MGKEHWLKDSNAIQINCAPVLHKSVCVGTGIGAEFGTLKEPAHLAQPRLIGGHSQGQTNAILVEEARG